MAIVITGPAEVGAQELRPGVPNPMWDDIVHRATRGRTVKDMQDGSVRMDSALGDYRELSAGGPWLPYEISVSWPDRRASMEFQVRRWRFVEQVRSDSKQFAMPSSCE